MGLPSLYAFNSDLTAEIVGSLAPEGHNMCDIAEDLRVQKQTWKSVEPG